MEAKTYNHVLNIWTRSAKVYDNLDTMIFATATFHTPEFRRAFAIAYPHIYGHGSEITKRELVELTDDVEQYHTFFLTAYTPKQAWNDLAEPDSIWRLTLESSNSVTVLPQEVIPVRIDENIRAVYPYIGHFDKAYLVRFKASNSLGKLAIDATTSELTMTVASALGAAKLRWQIQPYSPISTGGRASNTPQ